MKSETVKQKMSTKMLERKFPIIFLMSGKRYLKLL